MWDRKQQVHWAGGRHAPPSHHPSPSTQPHYPNLGYPAGYSQNVTPHPTSDLFFSVALLPRCSLFSGCFPAEIFWVYFEIFFPPIQPLCILLLGPCTSGLQLFLTALAWSAATSAPCSQSEWGLHGEQRHPRPFLLHSPHPQHTPLITIYYKLILVSGFLFCFVDPPEHR